MKEARMDEQLCTHAAWHQDLLLAEVTTQSVQ